MAAKPLNFGAANRMLMKTLYPAGSTTGLFFLMILSAQSMTGQKSDPSALTLLRGLKTHYENYKSMSMDFAVDITDLESDITEVKQGKMWVQGLKFRVQLDDQIVVCDNETVWVYLEEVNELQINNFEPGSEDFMSPAELFDLPEAEYFTVMGEQLTEVGKKIQILELSPTDKTLDYHKIKLYVNLSDKSLHKAIVLDKNGIHYTYRIEKFAANPPVTEETFHFNPARYPNIDIIDLRN